MKKRKEGKSIVLNSYLNFTFLDKINNEMSSSKPTPLISRKKGSKPGNVQPGAPNPPHVPITINPGQSGAPSPVNPSHNPNVLPSEDPNSLYSQMNTVLVRSQLLQAMDDWNRQFGTSYVTISDFVKSSNKDFEQMENDSKQRTAYVDLEAQHQRFIQMQTLRRTL